jgi:ubiquitin-like 1-activating enzyme E1 A
MRALSDEICKNLALAGVSSITLLDSELVTEEDLGAQFFLSEEDIGKNVRKTIINSSRSLMKKIQVACCCVT